MMKILFISQDYYPQLSGVPVVVQYLAEGLVMKGFEVSVATCRRKDNSYKEVINGVNVYRFDIYQNVLKLPSGCIEKYKEFVFNFECGKHTIFRLDAHHSQTYLCAITKVTILFSALTHIAT